MTTIRSEIEKHLSFSGHNLATFAKVSGLNRGSLSAILHANPPKPISLGQLDALTKAFGLPEGWLYYLYIEECFNEDKVSRRRAEPFLIRCAELDKSGCIDEMLNRILETPKPLELIFKIAEILFQQGEIRHSLVFYKLITENDTDAYSERLAISQYRIFKSLESVVDTEEKFRAVIKYEPFRSRLPERYALDGLLKLANVCFTLHKWKDAEKYADELRALTNGILREQVNRRNNGRRSGTLELMKPLVYYYGHGYFLKAVALTKQGHYEEAKKYTTGYADLSGFELLDDEGRVEVDQFKFFAEGNNYTLQLLSGNHEVLPRYADFLSRHPGELLPGLITIVECASRYGYSVEEILARFSKDMLEFEQLQDPVNLDRRFRLDYQLAMYLIDREQYELGIDYALRGIRKSIAMNNGKGFIRCVTLFEFNRDFASHKQQAEFHEFIQDIRSSETFVTGGSCRFGLI